jgi:hypothetical protein
MRGRRVDGRRGMNLPGIADQGPPVYVKSLVFQAPFCTYHNRTLMVPLVGSLLTEICVSPLSDPTKMLLEPTPVLPTYRYAALAPAQVDQTKVCVVPLKVFPGEGLVIVGGQLLPPPPLFAAT